MNGGLTQWRSAVPVLCPKVGAPAQENFGNLKLIAVRRRMQRGCPPMVIFVVIIDVSPCVQKNLDEFRMPFPSGTVQWGGPILIPCLDKAGMAASALRTAGISPDLAALMIAFSPSIEPLFYKEDRTSSPLATPPSHQKPRQERAHPISINEDRARWHFP